MKSVCIFLESGFFIGKEEEDVEEKKSQIIVAADIFRCLEMPEGYL